MTDKTRVKITADDFGMSESVDSAILSLAKENALTHASALVTYKGCQLAIKRCKEEAPALKIGLHLNLVTGKSVKSKNGILCDENGFFKNGFVKLLFFSIIKPQKLRIEVYNEVIAQIRLLRSYGASVCYLDSHRHVHYIPLIYSEATRAAKDEGIMEIRTINEPFIPYFKSPYLLTCLFHINFLKYVVIHALGLFNKHKEERIFISMIMSCRLNKKYILKYLKYIDVNKKIEIMVHPADKATSKNYENYEEADLAHLNSINRRREKDVCIFLKDFGNA